MNRKARTFAIVGGIAAAVLLVVAVILMNAVGPPRNVNAAATATPAPTATTTPTSPAQTSAPAPTATTATPPGDKPGSNCSPRGKKACGPRSSASPSPNVVVMSDVVGKNAAAVDDELRQLGFTRVQYRSAEPGDPVTRTLADWIITKQSAAAGSKVATDTLIVLTAVKQ